MESGQVYSGKMFIDATYEGDLMAATAAVLAIEKKVSLQKLPYQQLQEVLVKNKQVLQN